ncbi:hypothetical protein D3C73_1390710 [compost metagenome]
MKTCPCRKWYTIFSVFGILSWAIFRQSLISILRKKARMMATPKLAMNEENEPTTPIIYWKNILSQLASRLVAFLK